MITLLNYVPKILKPFAVLASTTTLLEKKIVQGNE